jgi:site-specific DNA-cytosine methylase
MLRPQPDIAINHNDDALSMHRMKPPVTRTSSPTSMDVDPHGHQDRPVGWLHLSPDCTHHSQASGGQPRSKKIRGLSWVGYRWAGQVRPDVISLENVKQILKWGPLVAKPDKATGRVVKLDGSVAEPGEQAPAQQQYLVPDPKREGQTWRKFVAALEHLGYKVEWRILVAADFGGHTTRERLFMIAAATAPDHIGRPDPLQEAKKGQTRGSRPRTASTSRTGKSSSSAEASGAVHHAPHRQGVQPYVRTTPALSCADRALHAPTQRTPTTSAAHHHAATRAAEFAMLSPVLIHAATAKEKG